MNNKIQDIKNIVEEQFDNEQFDKNNPNVQKAIENTIKMLGNGQIRVAEKHENGQWHVNTWIKKAILLHFKTQDMRNINNAPGDSFWWDKIKPKFARWNENDFINSGIRSVPGSFVREGSYVAPKVILMPSFINIGAYVDQATMVDTWATIGSCAQIGKNVHISGGAGIGGVLEPLQANPVIIEDDCFIGARAEVAEGVIVEKGAVLSMGVYIGASTKIVERDSGKIIYGKVPAYSVVVPGSIPPKKQNQEQNIPSLYCAVIIKKVDAKTRQKISINKLLRE